ncbi:MAG: small basic protein [Planctomycetes bacterium]|nr:small basic protein [Planctomycetota bacterium]
MTVHSSLKLKSSLQRSRNVFKRVERLEVLEKDGKRKTEDSVYNLPKVRTRLKVKKVKSAAPAAAPGAAPAAAAKPAAGAKPAAAAAPAKGAAKK